jgi:hypothetical protein
MRQPHAEAGARDQVAALSLCHRSRRAPRRLGLSLLVLSGRKPGAPGDACCPSEQTCGGWIVNTPRPPRRVCAPGGRGPQAVSETAYPQVRDGGASPRLLSAFAVGPAGDLGPDTRSSARRALDVKTPVECLDAVREPRMPLPRLGSAPPMPSSTISTSTCPFSRMTRTLATDACAYFATLVRASATR